MSQTYQNWEWIIVDDGSTDGTGDIIRSVTDSRIRYIFQENAGIDHLNETYNRALMMCNGDLVAMLDGDDYWPEYKLQAQGKDFSSLDIVLSYGECMVVNGHGKKMYYRQLPTDWHVANNDPVGSSLKLFLLGRDCFIVNSTVMLNKKALLSIGGFLDVEDMAHDFTTWTRLSLEGRFLGKPLCLGYWRRHLSSTNYNRNPELLLSTGLDFLRDFVASNKEKLGDLGFLYERDTLDAYWSKLNPYTDYYARSIIALSSGCFSEGRAAFRKFIEGDASLKQRLIYYTILLSSLIRLDLVNPLVDFKARAEKILNIICERSPGGK